MIKISVSASRNYDVIMERGALGRAGSYVREALGMAAAGERIAAAAESDAAAEAARVGNADAAADAQQAGNADTAAGNANASADDDTAAGTPRNGRKLCIVTDAVVDDLYGQPEHVLWRSLTEAGFDVYKYVFAGGETHKTMGTVASILEYLAGNRFSRSDVLLALGGGITGDVTGFAAASYLRGVEFIQVPTSLLAVVDSSVGGKTGVNLGAGKNLAGAFWQPSLALFDPDVLATLSDDLKLDGIAEAVKVGIIADPSIVDLARLHGGLEDDDFLTMLAAKAVEVKRGIVEEDERESGSRKLLNLGHTLAHAIEKCSNYEIRHGHAVAMGMDIVSAAADSLGWSEAKCHGIIRDLLDAFNFPLACPYSAEELTAAALQDKKIRGGDITLVIPADIGRCLLKTIPTEELHRFIACGLAAVK